MVIYANKVIKITFLPINHILFIFKHSFSLDIFIRPFWIIIRQKIWKSQLISYVIPCFDNFLCISLFFYLMYFIVFVVLFHPLLQFNYFDSQNNHLNFNQDPITHVWSVFRKNDFAIRFVHKSRKWVIFRLTCKDKRSRDLVTVGPIFKKIILKVAQGLKEKSQRAAGRHPYAFPSNQKNCGGGGGHNGPPGLIRVKAVDIFVIYRIDTKIYQEFLFIFFLIKNWLKHQGKFETLSVNLRVKDNWIIWNRRQRALYGVRAHTKKMLTRKPMGISSKSTIFPYPESLGNLTHEQLTVTGIVRFFMEWLKPRLKCRPIRWLDF